MPESIVDEKRFQAGGLFQIAMGNLLNETTDCIVNAANGSLGHGGGVAAAIASAAGPALEEEGARIVAENGSIPVGTAVVTTAGRLPFKGVIHAVGPRLGDGDEGRTLEQALTSAFLLAHNNGWKSLSFPAVSSGIFAVPGPICARAYAAAVSRFFNDHPDSPLKLIRLVLFKGPMVEEVIRTMDQF